MMLRERCGFAAVLGIVLVSVAMLPGQTAPQKPKVVQPDQGAPPDQAVEPDISAQLPPGQQEQFPEPVPVPVPVSVPPEAAPVAASPASAAPAAASAAPASADTLKMPPTAQNRDVGHPPEVLPVPANTPEGRHLQKETATLLQLAQDLKAEIEKAGNNTLSLAALRKAEEIQKMTKDLRQEMNKEEQTAVSK